MAKHTGRDLVWDRALQHAINEESFKLDEIAEHESVDVSERTIRDTLNTLTELGWLSKEAPKSNEWNPGSLVIDGEVSERVEDELPDYSDAATLEEIETPSELSEDEVYVATVDRYTGNAIITLPSGHLNLGPIDESAVGEEVRFRQVTGTWVECLDEEYIYEGYDPRDGSSQLSSRSKSKSKSKRRSKPIGTSTGTSGDGTITDNDPDNKNELLKGNM
jgi:hypothetical protein